jgi:Cupin-like domain
MLKGEAMKSTRPMTEVPRVERPSAEVFRERYLKPAVPIVLADAVSDWPASRRWSPEYFAATMGDKEVLVFAAAADGRFGLNAEHGGPEYEPRPMSIRTFVEQYIDGEPDAGLPQRFYIQRLSIPDALPELLDDIVTPDYVEKKQVLLTNLWFGPAGNTTKLHYDVPNNFFAQVVGRKRFLLFPPNETKRLYRYRTKAYNMSQVDPDQPDLNRFPLYRGVEPIEVELQDGDMLFLPSFWWHQVHSLTTGMSVNFWSVPPVRRLLNLSPQMRDNFPQLVKDGLRMARGKRIT